MIHDIALVNFSKIGLHIKAFMDIYVRRKYILYNEIDKSKGITFHVGIAYYISLH